VSKPYPGTVHDFEVRKQGPPLPEKSRTYVDSGYQGLDKVHQATELPYKKPKNGELTPEEKEYNSGLASFRVRIETKLREIKIFRIIAERYRNKRRGYGVKFNIVTPISFKNSIIILTLLYFLKKCVCFYKYSLFFLNITFFIKQPIEFISFPDSNIATFSVF